MKPSVGRIVLYHGQEMNGVDITESPAVVTRVWSDTCVNLTVLPDGDTPFTVRSVSEDPATTQKSGWRWPPRV